MSDLLQWMMGKCAEPIRGVLHIGANAGQEASYYWSLGLKVIWIEGDPALYESLKVNIAPLAQTAHLCLASDVDGRDVEFHIASNDGGSSSVLKPNAALLSREWPGIREVKSVRLTTCRLDSLFGQRGCDLAGVNLIVADVQGYELPVLRGLGSLMEGFQAVIAELNWAPMYEGATKPYELEDFLVNQGFKRVWLGLAYPQATGIWVRASAGSLERVYMALSARTYFLAARCGLVRSLRALGILGLGRKLYCTVKRRER